MGSILSAIWDELTSDEEHLHKDQMRRSYRRDERRFFTPISDSESFFGKRIIEGSFGRCEFCTCRLKATAPHSFEECRNYMNELSNLIYDYDGILVDHEKMAENCKKLQILRERSSWACNEDV